MKVKISDGIHRICMTGVKVTGIFMMAYLFLLSMFSTSIRSVRNSGGSPQEPAWDRYIYFFRDSPLYILGVILVFLILLLLCKRVCRWEKLKYFPSSEILCAVYFGLLLLFVWNTQFYPKSDPSKMLRIAEEILNRDFHEFEVGGYLHRYPYQSGFIFYCMAALKLFGGRAFLVLQGINALSLTAVLYLLGKSAQLLWNYNEKQRAAATLAFVMGSVPLSLYVTFVYGNIPGMAFSVAGIYLELLYFYKRKPGMIVGSAVCIALATVLKSNCLIFWVAMLIVLLVDILISDRKKKKMSAAACMMMLFFYLAFNRGAYRAMEALTGQTLAQGLPESAFVMMGLEEGFAAPGTENGSSTRIFIENNYDYDVTDRVAKETISLYLQEYIRDWRKGVSFFGRKQAAQCNEATFQCFSIHTDRKTDIQVPDWIQSFLYGKGSLLMSRILDVIHSLLIFGVLVYVCTFSAAKRKIWELLFLIAYVGDFIFQLFWEAKSQYMVIFFFVLLPYAAQGYKILTEKLYGFLCDRGKVSERIRSGERKLLVMAGVILLILPLCIRVRNSQTFANVIALESDEAIKQEYYEIVSASEWR